MYDYRDRALLDQEAREIEVWEGCSLAGAYDAALHSVDDLVGRLGDTALVATLLFIVVMAPRLWVMLA